MTAALPPRAARQPEGRRPCRGGAHQQPAAASGRSSPSCCRAGYVDAAGMVHRDGVMRLATARDEIMPLRDPRVRENPSYLTVLLLSRVVTRLGTADRSPRRRHRGPVRRPTWRSCRTSTAGSTRRATPRPRSPARVQPRVHGRRGRWSPGGIVTYAADRLYEEVAYVAYHFHWPLDEILDLEHPLRQRFVEEIGQINRRIAEEG